MPRFLRRPATTVGLLSILPLLASGCRYEEQTSTGIAQICIQGGDTSDGDEREAVVEVRSLDGYDDCGEPVASSCDIELHDDRVVVNAEFTIRVDTQPEFGCHDGPREPLHATCSAVLPKSEYTVESPGAAFSLQYDHSVGSRRCESDPSG